MIVHYLFAANIILHLIILLSPQLHKIALVPISMTYHHVELCWLTSEAKMPKLSLFHTRMSAFPPATTLWATF